MNPTTEQKTTVSEAVRKHKEFLFPAVATYYQEPIALVKGEGEYVWDDAGNRYLDCFGGVLTVIHICSRSLSRAFRAVSAR
jgi:4-aminobutyrate aminotransferase-like enzyme